MVIFQFAIFRKLPTSLPSGGIIDAPRCEESKSSIAEDQAMEGKPWGFTCGFNLQFFVLWFYLIVL